MTEKEKTTLREDLKKLNRALYWAKWSGDLMWSSLMKLEVMNGLSYKEDLLKALKIWKMVFADVPRDSSPPKLPSEEPS